LPAIYPFRYFAEMGGLVAYGIDNIDMYRRAAAYADRILRGASPSSLPVEAPTKFELINQSEDRQCAENRCPADAARPRRRGDRMSMDFAAVHESACGRFCCKSRRGETVEYKCAMIESRRRVF
jgi:hypothetical protein